MRKKPSSFGRLLTPTVGAALMSLLSLVTVSRETHAALISKLSPPPSSLTLEPPKPLTPEERQKKYSELLSETHNELPSIIDHYAAACDYEKESEEFIRKNLEKFKHRLKTFQEYKALLLSRKLSLSDDFFSAEIAKLVEATDWLDIIVTTKWNWKEKTSN